MKRHHVLAGIVMALAAWPTQAVMADTTIVFQQGLNAYSGCQDSFLNTGAYSEDAAGVCYGLNRFLILNSEHYEDF
jgi:hypothetical protein